MIKNIKLLFGTNVKKYRLEQGLSQEELAYLSGLHRTYISDVERGSRNPSLETMNNISLALNIKLTKLLTFEE